MANQFRVSLAAVLLTLLLPAAGSGQDPAPDASFGSGVIYGAPCPPSFPAVYPYSGRFYWGRSRFTMRQYDEYHASLLYTYAFVGVTTDDEWQISGNHHVAEGQCISAAYSYWTGAPAVIAYLHNAQITFRGRVGAGGECGTYRFVDSSEPCDSSGGGSGGGTGDEPGDDGGQETNVCETLRLYPGSCYDVYVDGVYQGEICC